MEKFGTGLRLSIGIGTVDGIYFANGKFNSSGLTTTLGSIESPRAPDATLTMTPIMGPPPEWNKFCQPQHCIWGYGGCSTWLCVGGEAVVPGPANWQNKFHQPTGKRVSEVCAMVPKC